MPAVTQLLASHLRPSVIEIIHYPNLVSGSTLNGCSGNDASFEGIQCGVRAWPVGNVLWGSGGVGWMPAGSARAVRGPSAADQRAHGRPAADALRRPRWYSPAADGERHSPDDARRRRQSSPSRPPLPAPPSAPPRWAAAALSTSLFLCVSLSVRRL